MEMPLHRGRLIDHLHLVVRDIDASRRFYTAVMGVPGVPVVEASDTFFFADELVVSAVDGPEAQGIPTGRQHIAFQATDQAMVDAFHAAALAQGARTMARRGSALITPAITLPSYWTRMATTSRPCITAPPRAAPPRSSCRSRCSATKKGRVLRGPFVTQQRPYCLFRSVHH